MELDEDQIAKHIRDNPPACVAGFRLSPAELPEPFDDNFQTVYGLSCKCGMDHGSILGYPLTEYNSKYDGSDFISPLSFKCGKCATVTQILDTDIHGYHAEVGKLQGGIGSAKLRGDGEPVAFVCPGCSAILFSLIVGFVYWDFDIILDEPELPAQEFFNVFLIYGVCKGCGKASSVADLGKL
jgi:hypothetical protein